MNKTELNIDNLTRLWKVAGKAFQGFDENLAYSLSKIKNSEWPNRVWANKPVSQGLIPKIKLEMERISGLTFSNFNENNVKNSLIADDDFVLKSTQYGMSLPLGKKFKTRKNMDFKQVKTKSDADLWGRAFYQAFNYNIGAETVLKTKRDILYFLVFYKEELVGTIVLFSTGQVAGIHSLGIIPSQRKNGFATEIMYSILNLAIDKNLTLATLQASEMAKEMYLKMGFTSDFLMENYVLKNSK